MIYSLLLDSHTISVSWICSLRTLLVQNPDGSTHGLRRLLHNKDFRSRSGGREEEKKINNSIALIQNPQKSNVGMKRSSFSSTRLAQRNEESQNESSSPSFIGRETIFCIKHNSSLLASKIQKREYVILNRH